MQVLDCRNLKELLDSYLSDELLVETNHAVLRHVEQCPACRTEMAGRRSLRASLRRAGTQVRMSVEGRERLRERLRAEVTLAQVQAKIGAEEIVTPRTREPFFKRWIEPLFAALPGKGFSLPVAAAAMLLVALGVGGFFLLRPQITTAAALSEALWKEAMGDHDYCAAQFRHEAGPARMSEKAKNYDAAYADLDRIAEVGAAGLKLHAAHVCGFAGRNFAHLVYTRGDDLISLLVTERNPNAMKKGGVPPDDGLTAGLQQAVQGNFKISAYQTRKHIVLVVTSLSETETKTLAEKIAKPVSNHLRNLEIALLPPDSHR